MHFEGVKTPVWNRKLRDREWNWFFQTGDEGEYVNFGMKSRLYWQNQASFIGFKAIYGGQINIMEIYG